MRFAPRIIRTTLTSTVTSATIIPANESVIIWGIVLHGETIARVFNFFKANQTTNLFNIGTSSSPSNKSNILDVPFILDGGLFVSVSALSVSSDIIVFASNVGA